jgi:hypothetical protein
LSKAKRSDIKDIPLVKVTIPISKEEINKKTDEEKIKMKMSDLNDLAYTELILFINVRTISGKFACNIVKGYKIKDHTERHV